MKIWNTCIHLFFLLVGGTLAAQAGYRTLLDYNTKHPVRYAGDLGTGQVLIPAQYQAKRNEFRGIWIATVENIDFKKHSTAAEFKQDYQKMLQRIKAAGFTAVIFQVRPTNDAFYPSRYNPYSAYMTGKEGVGYRDFDPMRFLVSEAHRQGLEFHAWLNPYRVKGSTPLSARNFAATLDPNNFARRNPEFLLQVPTAKGNLIILNPGEPAAIKHILDTVEEIYTRYDVDGIHMDDYFYPYESIGTSDLATFRKYNSKKLSLDDWRRNNVDTLIHNLSIRIKQYNQKNKKSVRFGISPFGIWANKTQTNANPETKSMVNGSLTQGSQSYFQQHADTRRWIKEGWIDYIAPQLYWSFSHNKAAYAALADWWADTVRGTNTDLYIGHAPSRLGINPDWKNPEELVNQLKYNCRRPEIKGSIFFSYVRIFEPGNPTQKEGSRRVVEDLWHRTLR